MECLLENKKIAQATHNIYAYRITTEKGTILQDCDDDGEAHAGGRVLHLLQILNISNVMVVVSRWYVLIFLLMTLIIIITSQSVRVRKQFSVISHSVFGKQLVVLITIFITNISVIYDY